MPKVKKPKKKPRKGVKTMKKGRCWTGYKPTPGKKPFTKGSCMKAK